MKTKKKKDTKSYKVRCAECEQAFAEQEVCDSWTSYGFRGSMCLSCINRVAHDRQYRAMCDLLATIVAEAELSQKLEDRAIMLLEELMREGDV